MKIAIMTLWNAANGASIHAELIGRAWIKLGHQVKVFSAVRHPDARPTSQFDEDYVVRHFSVDKVLPFTRATSFDASPLVEEDYDVFVAENVERLPAEGLLQVFTKIRSKAITINVVHEPSLSVDPLYSKFAWDAVVCFDYRYKEYLAKLYPEDMIYVIPYPYHPLELGSKSEARKALGFPSKERILFSFGIRARCMTFLPPVLSEVNESFPLRYVVVSNPGSRVEILQEMANGYDFMDLRIGSMPLNEIYAYLHAADAHLIYRELPKRDGAVLSSTVFQTLGSGCPIFFNDSKYVELNGKEIVKYKDAADLKTKLAQIFQNGFDPYRITGILAEQNSAVVAERFIRLFEEKRALTHRESL